MMEALGYFFMSWLDIKMLLLTAAGTFAGIYIGAIPGLSVTMAVSILISFTFKWHVNEALALISGIYLGGVYGGSRSAILLNIPGAPAAIATGLDGYPLAKRGEAGQAIGLTTVVSVYGGFIGILALAVAAPAVSDLALKFGPREYLLLALWGILLVGSLSGESIEPETSTRKTRFFTFGRSSAGARPRRPMRTRRCSGCQGTLAESTVTEKGTLPRGSG